MFNFEEEEEVCKTEYEREKETKSAGEANDGETGPNNSVNANLNDTGEFSQANERQNETPDEANENGAQKETPDKMRILGTHLYCWKILMV